MDIDFFYFLSSIFNYIVAVITVSRLVKNKTWSLVLLMASHISV